MLYKNELVLTGKINDVGEYTRTNTPRSWRLGMEFQGSFKPAAWIQASGNLTISENKISDYTSYVDDYDHRWSEKHDLPENDYGTFAWFYCGCHPEFLSGACFRNQSACKICRKKLPGQYAK